VGRFDLAEVQFALGRDAEAAASVRAACSIAERLVQRDRTVADWAGPNRARCLTLRARLALAQNMPGEALVFARQALGPARQTPKTVDRRASIMLALSEGSAALQAAGRAAEAAEWARRGVAIAPPPSMLMPNELAQLAGLHSRTGNQAQAAQISARLKSFGYHQANNRM